MRLAERWHCPPWVVEAGPARYMRMLRIQELGNPPEKAEGGETKWQ